MQDFLELAVSAAASGCVYGLIALAYLRTLSMAQIEGASGLQHLREDLNERVAIRTKGAVRELIVESLVVQ